MVFLNESNLSTLINPIIKSVGSDETGDATPFNTAVSISNPKAGDLYSNGEKVRKKTPGYICRLNISTIFQIVKIFLNMIKFKYSWDRVLSGSSVKPIENRKKLLTF